MILSYNYIEEKFFVATSVLYRLLIMWLLIAIMKRWAEGCALQLYRTSLTVIYSVDVIHIY